MAYQVEFPKLTKTYENEAEIGLINIEAVGMETRVTLKNLLLNIEILILLKNHIFLINSCPKIQLLKKQADRKYNTKYQ